MVARLGAIAAAAVMGVSLQGCTEAINKHITNAIEQSCAAATSGLGAEAEKKFLAELGQRCKENTEDGTLKELYQQCLDDGAETIKEDMEAANKKATADCVEKLSAAASGRDIKNVLQNAQDLIQASYFNLTDSIHKRINQTAQHIHEEAKDALDAVKDGANGAIEDAKDKLDEVKDGVNQRIDNAQGAVNDAVDSVQDTVNGDEPERLFSMVRLPSTTAGSSTVACFSGAALLAVAGLVVVVRRASRQAAVEQCTPILACDEEL